MSNLQYIGKNILNHDLILKKGDISGSAASTGSLGTVQSSTATIPSLLGNISIGGTTTGTEQFLAPNGSTGTPSYGFSGEAQMGMYRPNPGQIGFSISNNYKFLIGGNEIVSVANHDFSAGIDVTGVSTFSSHITGSGNLEIAGNISGSATSTGSFSRVIGDTLALAGDGLKFENKILALDAGSSAALFRLYTENGSDSAIAGY